jgi:GntR family transcriptional regulator
VPLHKQIGGQLRAAIEAGEYEFDAKLPTVREVTVRELINPAAVRRAYSDLESEGLIRTVADGTVVCNLRRT